MEKVDWPRVVAACMRTHWESCVLICCLSPAAGTGCALCSHLQCCIAEEGPTFQAYGLSTKHPQPLSTGTADVPLGAPVSPAQLHCHRQGRQLLICQDRFLSLAVLPGSAIRHPWAALIDTHRREAPCSARSMVGERWLEDLEDWGGGGRVEGLNILKAVTGVRERGRGDMGEAGTDAE